MREGGFSTRNTRHNLKINRENFGTYWRHSGPVTATVAITLKLGYKSLGLIRCKLFPRQVASLARD
jgi:hypothetical protein